MANDGSLIFDTKINTDGFNEGIREIANQNSAAFQLTLANLASQMISKITSTASEAISQGIELASDVNEVKNVVDTTFGRSSEAIYEWANAAKEAFGISSLAAQNYVGSLGAMLKSSGVTADLNEMSTALAGLAGDVASFYNLDIDTAFEKIRSGISGETEPLKQLGINMSVANLEAYALAQGIETAYSAMSQAEQVTLRYNYLMSVTADAQGDFSKTSSEFANQQRIATLNIEEMKQALGEQLLPAAQDVITYFNEHADEIKETVSEIGSALADTVEYFLENKDACVSAAEAIATALIAYKGLSAVSSVATAISGVTTALGAATTAGAAFSAVISSIPLVALGSLLIAGANALSDFIDKEAELIGYEGEIKEAFNEANKAIAERNDLLYDLADGTLTDKKQAYDEAENDLEEYADKLEENNNRLDELYARRKEINIQRDHTSDTYEPEMMAQLNAELDAIEQEVAGINEQNIFLENALINRRYLINQLSDCIDPSHYMSQDILDAQTANAREVLERQKQALAESQAAALAAIEENNQLIADKWEELDHLYSMGVIASDKELYNKRLELLSQYGDESNIEHWRYYEALHNFEADLHDDVVSSAESSLNELQSLYKDKYDELLALRDSYRSKLLDISGSVFEINVTTDDDGVETKSYVINDIEAQIEKMRQYHENIKQLKDDGAGSALLEELTNLSGDDGVIMAEYVASLSEAERQKIIALYNEKEAIADELSSDLYADEALEMQAAFSTALSELETQSYDAGVTAAEQFSMGFSSSLNDLVGSAAFNYPATLSPTATAENVQAVGNSDSSTDVNVNVNVTGGSINFDGQKYGDYTLNYSTTTDVQKGR